MYRYINPGRIALFQNTPGTSWGETTDSKRTKTGVGFRNQEVDMLLPTIPTNTKEMWAKFDFYTDGTNRSMRFRFKSENTYCGTEGGQYSDGSIYINGSKKEDSKYTVEGINTFWVHIKSDSANGIFEVYINGTKRHEITGDILHGADIKNIELNVQYFSYSRVVSNIIVSDSPISLTEQVVTIPCTITTDMTKNEDGSYSATAVNQSLEYAIDASGFGAGTKFTGVNIAARNCIRDGEGVNNLEFLEGATSLDTQTIPTAENCGLSYGITLNDESPSTFALHNYKLKAK